MGQMEEAEGDRSGCFTAVIYLSVSACVSELLSQQCPS